jgi:putative transcriptional regulator
MKKNNRLISARKEMGYTQEQLAGLLEFQKSTVSNWENGYSTPRLPDAFRVADLLGKDVNYLFFEDEVQDSHTTNIVISTS